MNRWTLEETCPGLLRLHPTAWGRLRAGLSAFVIAALAGFAAMALFFGPDYVLDPESRGQGFGGFFIGFLIVGALLVASVAGVMRGLASWHWEFDWRRGVVRRSTRTTMGHRFDDELDLAQVERVELVRAGSALGTHALALCLDDGSHGAVVIIRSRSSLRELEALHARLTQALAP